MIKLLFSIFPVLYLASAQAQSGSAEAPIEPVSPLGAIIFLVCFVAFCIGIVWLIARQTKAKKKLEQDETTPGTGGPRP